MSSFITGVRGNGDAKQIRIHDPWDPASVWTWDPSDAEALMADEERTECSAVLNSMREWDGITEIKWAAGGTKIAAIIGGAAVLIDHTSKALLFGACNSTSMHSLEVLPDDRLAIVTSGSYESDGVWVYDTSSRIADHPIQKLPGLRSGHVLVWDETERMQWGREPTCGPTPTSSTWMRGSSATTSPTQESTEALDLKGLGYKARWFDEPPGWPTAR
ncbi:hypothetical protein [Streptomyces sp. NPDC059761]|uniref:hypothetical protein n=1 Tax=Streptomyces sp. NPDC059761 TaxID=3346937 RepID=UPI00364F72B4